MHCLATQDSKASPGRRPRPVLVGRNGGRVPKSYMMNFEHFGREYDNPPEDDEQCFLEFEGTCRRTTKSTLQALSHPNWSACAGRASLVALLPRHIAGRSKRIPFAPEESCSAPRNRLARCAGSITCVVASHGDPAADAVPWRDVVARYDGAPAQTARFCSEPPQSD